MPEDDLFGDHITEHDRRASAIWLHAVRYTVPAPLLASLKHTPDTSAESKEETGRKRKKHDGNAQHGHDRKSRRHHDSSGEVHDEGSSCENDDDVPDGGGVKGDKATESARVSAAAGVEGDKVTESERVSADDMTTTTPTVEWATPLPKWACEHVEPTVT